MSTGKEHLEALVKAMRHHLDNGNTQDMSLRKKLLLKLQETIELNQDALCDAAYADFHKPKAEMLLTEIYPVLAEIKNTLRHINEWAKPERVSTNLLMLPSSSRLHKSPQGLVMLFAPWNYSFWLSMMPLVSAVAAGNVVLLKPAHETPEISRMTQKIVAEVFPAEHVSVVLGEGAALGEILLENFEFDHIFFTGSHRVGRWIMEKAAKHLSKVTLELGGKSPSIIDDHFDLDKAARKIIWGKVINAGQTCVSTDYVLVPKQRVAEFTEACKRQILSLVGDQPFTSNEYCHIINEQRFDRLVSLARWVRNPTWRSPPKEHPMH
ncbi:MAG: aldehyde dehydrogenase family protein [Saprospiraceae bacterium]|nr:aldehyde dehydrogenase family protein [Saprospiraceae bacterium]